MKNIYYCKYHPTKPYRVIVRHKGKQVSGGYFTTHEDAVFGLYKLKEKLGFKYNLSIEDRCSIKSSLQLAVFYLDDTRNKNMSKEDEQKIEKLRSAITDIFYNY